MRTRTPAREHEPVSVPLWTAYLGFIAVGMSNNILGASWLKLQPVFGQPLGSVGVLIAALMVGGLASSLASGWLLARLSVAQTCALASALAVVGLMGYLQPWWPLLVLLSAVMGLGSGLLGAGLNTFVAAHYPASRMNWLHACYGAGSSLGPFLFTLWALAYGLPWQLVYAGIAGVYLVLLAVIVLYRRRWPQLRFKTEEHAPTPTQSGFRGALSLGVVWLGMTLLFVHSGLSVGSGQLTSSLLSFGRGVPADVAGNAAALYWACIMVGRLLVGGVIDRLGSARVLRFCTLVTVFGAALLWAAPTPLWGFVGLAVMGLTLAPVYPTAVSRTPQLVGAALSAHAIGLQVAAGSLGSAALPGVLSGVADRAGAELIAPGLVVFALLQFAAHELLLRHRTPRPVAAPNLEA